MGPVGIVKIQHIPDLVCANLLEMRDLFSSRSFGVCHEAASKKLIPFHQANEEVIYISKDSVWTDYSERRPRA